MREIKSSFNGTVRCLAGCFDYGWQGGSSIDAVDARQELFKHMRRNNHKGGYLEVGRTSHYELVETNKLK